MSDAQSETMNLYFFCRIFGMYVTVSEILFCELFFRQGLDQLENPITMELHWHPNPVSDVVFSQDGKVFSSKFPLDLRDVRCLPALGWTLSVLVIVLICSTAITT